VSKRITKSSLVVENSGDASASKQGMRMFIADNLSISPKIRYLKRSTVEDIDHHGLKSRA
jgi:hypothetical protein